MPKRATKKKVVNPRVPRNRAGGTWTNSQYFLFIRNALRTASYKKYPPIVRQALELAKRPSQSDNLRLKWEYCCAACGLWYARKLVRVDHIYPVGSLLSYDDAPAYIARLFCEPEDLRILCVDCDLDRGWEDVDDGEEG